MNTIQKIIREVLQDIQEELVSKEKDHDLSSPENVYKSLHDLIDQNGKSTVDGPTLIMKKPFGDIVAVAHDKSSNGKSLVTLDKEGNKKKLKSGSKEVKHIYDKVLEFIESTKRDKKN